MVRADATVSVSVGASELMTAAPVAGPPGRLPSPGELPFTGTPAGALALTALLLIVVGIALILLSHRKVPTHA